MTPQFASLLQPSMLRSSAGFAFALLMVFGVAAYIYWPGIDGPLMLDDYRNLEAVSNYGGVRDLDTLRLFVFGNSSGPVGRPLAMLSFLIDGRELPLVTANFKYTNIMIHLLSGLALCWLSFLLGKASQLPRRDAALLALAVTAIWLWHPMNVSTALYVVQRMTQLMTLFAMLALVCYLKARLCLSERPQRAHILLCLALLPFGLLSVLSKENGVLLLLLIVIIDQLFFRGHPQTRFFKLWYRGAILGSIGIVTLYLAIALPGQLETYEIRSFTLGERLLTEARALTDYLWKILLPDSAVGSVFQDDYPKSTSLLDPLSTLPALLMIGGLLVSAGYLARSQPVYSLAVLWFFSMHLLESTLLPLELYFEHRNYLAMVGPLFALCWYARTLLVSRADWRLKSMLGVSAVVMLALFLSLTVQSIGIWKDEEVFYRHMAEQHPRSTRAQLVYSIYLENERRLEESLERIYIAREYSPNEITILLHLWNFACRYGLEQPMSAEAIATLPTLRFHGDSISMQLNNMVFNISREHCPAPELEDMTALFDRVLEFPMGEGRRVQMNIVYSALYGYYGRPQQMMEMLQSSYELSPTVSSALRLLNASVGAGDMELAQHYLDLAREADSRRAWLLPSSRARIDAYARLLNERLDIRLN